VPTPQTVGTNDQSRFGFVRSGRLRRLVSGLLRRPRASGSSPCLGVSVVFFFVSFVFLRVFVIGCCP
jgi:hypothetical protein